MPKKKPLVEIVIPIYNEKKELEKNTLILYQFLEKKKPPFSWHITIADNASTDQSGEIGERLAREYKQISYTYLPQKGRGRAVKYVWSNEKADFFSYMDIDLSTDLNHFIPLIKALMSDYDIAIGSRLLPKSSVSNRPLKREILSRGYNFLIKVLFQTHFSDAQCGFKAVTKTMVENLVSKVKDNEWFFDSELLILGEKSGYRIFEEPVTWVDNPGSTVRVLKTVTGDLAGLWRLFWLRPWRRRGI